MQHFGVINRHTSGAIMPMSPARLSKLLLPTQFVIWVIYGVLAGMRHWPVGGSFILAAIATFVIRSTTFPKYSSVIIWVLYAGVSCGSILFGAPFTVQYARESAPPEHWHSPGFIRGNQVMSVVWSIAFTVNILLVPVAL